MGKSVTDIPFDPDRIDDDDPKRGSSRDLFLAKLGTIEVGIL